MNAKKTAWHRAMRIIVSGTPFEGPFHGRGETNHFAPVGREWRIAVWRGFFPAQFGGVGPSEGVWGGFCTQSAPNLPPKKSPYFLGV